MKVTHFGKTSALALSALLLAACGGDDEAKTESVDDQKLLGLVQQTNFSQGFPPIFSDNLWGTAYDQQGTVRFDTTNQIPLYYVSADGSNPPPVIANAITAIEARLGDIFTDFTVLTEDLTVYRDDSRYPENVGNNTFNADTFKNNHGIVGGLVISEGTGYYDKQFDNDPQSMCANAAVGPFTGSLALVVDPSTATYTSDTLLWANMGNGQCSWDTDIVIHEMAHGMGMFNHLDGYFGSWSNTAMDILDTIYGNPAGTAFSELTPQRN